MATQLEVVKQSELLNQLVLDLNTMEELGHIDVLWMHPPAHRVLGFICKSGLLGTKKTAFNLAQIKALGTNSVLVDAQPVATDDNKVRQLKSLLGCEIWSDAGNKIGSINDCLFHLKTGAITQYLFVSNSWSELASGIYLLPPSQILSFGSKRVLVSAAVVQNLSIYRPGIKQKLNQVRNFLKQDYTQVAQDWQTLAKQARLTTEQAKEQSIKLAQQAREKAQTLNRQLIQETLTLSEQAKQKGQTLVEQVKEQAQTINKQVKEGEPTQTAQVKETDSSAAENNLKVPPPPSTPTKNQPRATDSDPLEDNDEPWI